MAIDLSRYYQLVKEAQSVRIRGRVTELAGLVIKAAVPGVRVGEVVEIRGRNRVAVQAEVVGFQGEEVMLMPRKWVERYYNLKRWTVMPSGGHFAPTEEPELLARDIAAFFATVDR